MRILSGKKEKNAILGDSEYLTRKEERQIAKENLRITRQFEKQKRKKVPEFVYLTKMRDEKNIVEFDDLHTFFYTDVGTARAVNGVSYDIPSGATVGVVGESGCGKSVTSLSLMRLVQAPQGQIVSGSIRYQARDGNCYDLAKMPLSKMLEIRGKEISMIFQEPMTSLNPVFTVGEQLDEVVLLHEADATKASAKARGIEMLSLVGIAMADKVYRSYPHELSGGMRQRIMIAMALACNPRLIIADEPTTALDVTVQAQILDLLREIRTKMNGSILLITHDLGVIAEMADFVAVMYAGRIVEKGTVREIFHDPKHPYTIGLMKSKPSVGNPAERLYSIPGQVPNPINMPAHCYFKNRCEKCTAACGGEYPQLLRFSETHFAACHLYDGMEEKRHGE